MFSVVVPLYNKENQIRRCLNSIYSQSFKDFEIIVVDDGSTDHSASIVEQEYKNVRLVKQDNMGVSSARNTGVRHSKNQYVAFLDADDIWNVNYLSSVLSVIKKESSCNIDMIGTSYAHNEHQLFNGQEVEYFKVNNYFEMALSNTLFSSSSTVINKKILGEEIFDKKLCRGEDLDMWFRVILLDGNCFYIKDKLSCYYIDDDKSLSNITFDVSNSLLYKLSQEEYIAKADGNKKFSIFRDGFIYLNLLKYWFSESRNNKEESIFKSIKNRNKYMDLIYRIPNVIGVKLINNLVMYKLIRKAYIFFFR